MQIKVSANNAILIFIIKQYLFFWKVVPGCPVNCLHSNLLTDQAFLAVYTASPSVGASSISTVTEVAVWRHPDRSVLTSSTRMLGQAVSSLCLRPARCQCLSLHQMLNTGPRNLSLQSQLHRHQTLQNIRTGGDTRRTPTGCLPSLTSTGLA